MPILYGGFLTNASPDWEVIVTRPGGGPIDNLAEALLRSTSDYSNSDSEDKKSNERSFDAAPEQLAWIGGSDRAVAPLCRCQLFSPGRSV